jgi:hypothetical protein
MTNFFIGKFRDFGGKWANPVRDMHDAEAEIKRLIELRSTYKLRIKVVNENIATQFAIIDKCKEILK